ncbi:hypothetical protein [Streptomyces sp. NBC_00083]|uniref:hypothetical protein n=1 Tax=Streptomyces sp. NBC_00083 TaxID=2975647 RepID=UPI002254E717|nr:hypothetical protein [Streptomyces sp. NBC_00083]MCX5385325.1 hypothetical protein [Streptomyces sp. NBC_00083]
MKPRLLRSRAATAGVCLVALAAAASCGPADAGAKGAGGSVRDTGAAPGPSASTEVRAAPGALSSDQLAAAALVTGDVKDYSAEPMEGGTPTGSSRTSKDACMPFVSVINGTPQPAPSATVFRRLTNTTEDGQADQTVVTEVLGAHPSGATDVLPRLRSAIAACADGFTTKGGDLEPSAFTEVKELPAPKAGDEALSYELMGEAQGDPVPMVFLVVRSGTTVVTYYAVDVTGDDTPQIPVELAVAQAAKLKS